MKRKVIVEEEPKYFYCRFCGCLFEADKDDYKLVEGADEGIFAKTSCPDCGHEVKEHQRTTRNKEISCSKM